jgi:hypothetical protein
VRGECLLELLNFAEHHEAVEDGRPGKLRFRP